MRRLCRLLAAAVVLLALTGCWDRREVNDLALIMAMAIDQESSKLIEVSVQVFIPRSSGGGGGGEMQSGASGTEGSTLVRSAVGTTIGDALSRLQEKLPRSLFLGHDEVYIIGEEAAREGISAHVDFLARATQPRKRAYFFISSGRAKEALRNQPRLERSSAEAVREMAEMQTGMKLTVKDLEMQLSGESGAVAVPLLEKLPSEKNGKEAVYYIHGLGIIKKGRLIGKLDETLSRGVLWVRDEMKSAIITFPTGDENGGTASARSMKNQMKLVPEIREGKPRMKVILRTDTHLLQNTSRMNPLNREFNRQLEQQLNLKLSERVRQSLQTVQQKWNADIFGFADAFHRRYPQEWKTLKGQWDSLFPELEVSLQPQARILRSGSIGGSTAIPKEEVRDR